MRLLADAVIGDIDFLQFFVFMSLFEVVKGTLIGLQRRSKLAFFIVTETDRIDLPLKVAQSSLQLIPVRFCLSSIITTAEIILFIAPDLQQRNVNLFDRKGLQFCSSSFLTILRNSP